MDARISSDRILVLCVQSSNSFNCLLARTCTLATHRELDTDASTWLEKKFASTCHHRMVAEPLIADITANFEAGTNRFDQLSWRQSCWWWEAGRSPVPPVRHPCLCPPASQKLDYGTSSSRSGAAHRPDGRTCEHGWSRDSRRCSTRELRRQQQPAALADTRVLGSLECSSGAFAAWKSWRFTFTSHAGALSPDMKRSAGDRAMSTQLFHVLVMGFESVALRALVRPRDGRSHWVEVVGEGTRTRHCRTSGVVAVALLVLHFH